MSKNLYIKFNNKAFSSEKKKNQYWQKIIGIILFFIPKANPDYDHLIDDVFEWLIEIDPEDSLPIKEIGIGENGDTLFIMPWLDNYGFWTDNTISADYFKNNFKAIEIDESEFEKRWEDFATKNSA